MKPARYFEDGVYAQELEVGDIIQEGDQTIGCDQIWEKTIMGGSRNSGKHKYRRPCPTSIPRSVLPPAPAQGWIKLSERKPTEADANELGDVLSRSESRLCYVTHISHLQSNHAEYKLWLPIPKFTAPDPDKEAFEKAWFDLAECKGRNEVDIDRDAAEKFYFAALAYERSKK